MRLHFDGESGRYLGTRLMIAGSAVSQRIGQLTEAYMQQGTDPVDAAEQAWQTALEEASWDGSEDGVTVRSPGQELAPGPNRP